MCRKQDSHYWSAAISRHTVSLLRKSETAQTQSRSSHVTSCHFRQDASSFILQLLHDSPLYLKVLHPIILVTREQEDSTTSIHLNQRNCRALARMCVCPYIDIDITSLVNHCSPSLLWNLSISSAVMFFLCASLMLLCTTEGSMLMR